MQKCTYHKYVVSRFQQTEYVHVTSTHIKRQKIPALQGSPHAPAQSLAALQGHLYPDF